MENRTNQILHLSGKDYFINRQILYKGVTYYVVTLLKDEVVPGEGRDPDEKIYVFRVNVQDGEDYIETETDQELIKLIINNIF